MGFIKLTHAENGRMLQVRADLISQFGPTLNPLHANAWLRIAGETDEFLVKESPEEILALIKAEEDRELRDRFAMAALQGHLAYPGDCLPSQVVESVMTYVSMMMKARK